jgi:putative transposase
MARLINDHVRRHHRHYHSSGHIWQGRFKAFPIEEDDHLRVVLRYVERNPLRAGLVGQAEDWPWSSLRPASVAAPSWLDPGPAPWGEGWVEEVNRVADEGKLARLRRSVDRSAPFGSDAWASRAVEVLGLESSLRARSRPRKGSAEG